MVADGIAPWARVVLEWPDRMAVTMLLEGDGRPDLGTVEGLARLGLVAGERIRLVRDGERVSAKPTITPRPQRRESLEELRRFIDHRFADGPALLGAACRASLA